MQNLILNSITKIDKIIFMKYLSPFIIVLLMSCGPKSPIVVKNDPELQNIISQFFEKYQKYGSTDAVDFIFKTNDDVTKSQLTELEDKLSSLSLLAGRYNGYEQITIQKTSKSLIYYSFLVKHEKQPIRFIFIFYKPKDKWKIYKFKFDDQLHTELEQSGKVYFLQN